MTRVKWSNTSKKISNDTFEVHLTAMIAKGWNLFSQSTHEGGPVPTTISYTKNPSLTIEGEAKERGKLEKHFEKLFDVVVLQFSNKVDLYKS